MHRDAPRRKNMGAIIDKIKGKAKQIEGRLTGDKVREAQGGVEKTKGDAKGKASRVARKVKRGVRRATRKVKRGVRKTRARTY
jgi:uncharacterized protein YjbJ (UPF0337 family)